MISLANINVNFGANTVLKDVSFQIKPKDKIGLVGYNGAGKSTLLKIIAGQFLDFSGSVSIPKDTQLGYLPQFINVNSNKTVFDEAFDAFAEFKQIKKEFDKLNDELATRTDYESTDYQKLINRISELSDQLAIHDKNQFTAQTIKILKGLGFNDDDLQKPLDTFSGGWQMRVLIAKLLLRSPDIMLLDEPTNHLDIDSIIWFEQFLKSFPKSVIVISHDRRFLDNVTNRTIEIANKKIYDYPVPYSKYIALRLERLEHQKATYENQQSKIKSTERFIERFRAKASKASQVQARIKMLERIEKIELDEQHAPEIKFHFPPAPRSGDIVAEARQLSKSFGAKQVLKNVDFILNRGEKVAFVGKNGMGKTTFVRILTGELDYSGFLKIGHNVKIGYYAQNQDKTLNPKMTVFETLDHAAKGDIRTQIRNILGAFLFRNDDIHKKVSVLSGGERARLALARLILEPHNLLILDEPTNHLDMISKDILKQALLLFDGTLIIVSHDREFLDGLADTVYEFTPGRIKQYKGDINYFLEKKNLQFIEQMNISQKQPVKNKTSQKNDYLQRKAKKQQREKIVRAISKIETEIEQLETELASIEQKLQTPENIDNETFTKHAELKNLLEEKMQKWEDLQTDLENFDKEN